MLICLFFTFGLQVDDSMQRVLAKERSSQSKALDLQSQLSRAKTELSQLQRNKEEVSVTTKSLMNASTYAGRLR